MKKVPASEATRNRLEEVFSGQKIDRSRIRNSPAVQTHIPASRDRPLLAGTDAAERRLCGNLR